MENTATLLFVFFIMAVLGSGIFMYFHNQKIREAIALMIAVGSGLAFLSLLHTAS